jgi:hypothetical protein
VKSSHSSIEDTGMAVPDPAPWPVRRSFTASYKLAVVAEYEAPPPWGEGRGAA